MEIRRLRFQAAKISSHRNLINTPDMLWKLERRWSYFFHKGFEIARLIVSNPNLAKPDALFCPLGVARGYLI